MRISASRSHVGLHAAVAALPENASLIAQDGAATRLLRLQPLELRCDSAIHGGSPRCAQTASSTPHHRHNSKHPAHGHVAAPATCQAERIGERSGNRRSNTPSGNYGRGQPIERRVAGQEGPAASRSLLAHSAAATPFYGTRAAALGIPPPAARNAGPAPVLKPGRSPTGP